MKLYDDIIVYDDEGRRITNRDTLEAMREAMEISKERKKRWGIADDEEREPNYVEVYDYADEVPNAETWAAILESEQMIADWERRWGLMDYEEQKKVS